MTLSQAEYKLLEVVDHKTQCAVYGFIHEIENSLISATNIPVSIIKICILFFWNREYFEKCGKHLTISGDQNETILKTDNGWNNVAVGSMWIQSNRQQIIKWTFEIIKSPPFGGAAGIYFGITSEDHHNLNQDASDCKKGFGYFCYHDSHTTLIFDKGVCVRSDYGEEKASFGKQGTVTTMELNLKAGHLIYYVDDECLGVAIDNVQQDDDIRYKLAVGLYDKGVELKLVNFECF